MKRFLSLLVGFLVFFLVTVSYAETVAATAVGKITAITSAVTAVAKVGAGKTVKPEALPATKSATTDHTSDQPKPPFIEGQYVPETYLGMDKRARVSRGLHFFTPFPWEVDSYEDGLEIREHGIAVNYQGQPVYFILLTPKFGAEVPYEQFAAYYCFDYTESPAGGIQMYLYKMTELWVKSGEARNQIYFAPNECAKPTEEAMFR